MPGLLSMEQQPSELASATQYGTAKSTADEPKANGEGMEGVKSTALPSLDDSWRSSTANVSFGKLLERLAEGCFADLSELVVKLTNAPIDNAGEQANGTHVPGTVDIDPVSLAKKNDLMNFAKEWRERFIKARIISDWARSSGEDVARTIDLRNTLATRMSQIHSTLTDVFKLKLQTPHLRMPQPNIKGAMQYLTTGQSSYPDLGYIPNPPLSAQQVLDMQRDMEITANLRIWLNEPKPPWYLTDYRLENGRVAWVCPGEFEVDLAVVDQLPEKSPWYFVELRPLFSPTPVISGEARAFLEGHINAAALANSIQGVYDFCHNYILDYKITELETQAINLLKGPFFSTLRIQRLRRIITVQYWTSRGGKRSWLEFSVHSGVGFNMSHEPVTPVNHLRWFKEGKLVEDAKIDMDWTNLSMEKTLLDAQHKHSLSLLKGLADGLAKKKINVSVFDYSLDLDEQDPDKNVLVLSMPNAHPACAKEIKISIAPYTGHWVISPPHKKLSDLQANIIKNPAVFTADTIELFISDMMQDGLELESRLQRWTRIFNVHPDQRGFKSMFEGAVQVTVWKCHDILKQWPEKWAIAYSTSLHHAQWWVVQTQFDGRPGVAEAHKLQPQNGRMSQQMRELEQHALKQVQSIELKARNQNNISYHVDHSQSNSRLTRAGQVTAYYLFAKELMKTGMWQQGLAPFWGRSIMRIASLSDQDTMCLSISPGKLVSLRHYLRKGSTKGIAMNGSNGLAVSFQTRSNLWASACSALVRVASLDHMLQVATSLGIIISSITLATVTFSYGPTQAFSAHVPTKGPSTELQLLPQGANPHQRIHSQLQQILRADDTRAFERFAHALLFTLPALTTLSKLDIPKDGVPICSVHTRNISWYSIKYIGTPSITFTLRVRERSENGKRIIRWQLSPERPRPGTPSLPEEFNKALQDLWTTPGVGCESLKLGLTATSTGISTALQKLHNLATQHIAPMPSAEEAQLQPEEPEDGTQLPPRPNGASSDVIMLD